MKRWRGLLVVLLFSTNAFAASSAIFSQAKQLLNTGDYLGFRMYMKSAYGKKITYGEWYSLKNLIASAGDRAGFDLIPFWNARNNRAHSDLDDQLFKVDELLKQGQFESAFDLAQSVAEKMKQLRHTRWDAGVQLPYIYHSMGRALYGAQRYDDAVKVYQWIGPKYPYFAQTLFEKMWAAFKAGRVDLALGAIASQRTAYLSNYLPPESYLVQSYLYRRLCRDDDQKQVLDEMKAYQTVLSDPNSILPVTTDVNTLVLWQVANLQTKETDNLKLFPQAARDKEQSDLKAALKRVIENHRAKTLKDIQTVIAYQQLGGQADSKTVLKPVERMKSRDDLLKQNLEVWPADSKEEWMDELGKHMLIGESLCKQQK